ncbi:MAG: ABC transporter ATP-binding protein [Chloroflexi bacterium]|nr:ABC transporter ATP-binding protein [Chloroflexota bacterium]
MLRRVSIEVKTNEIVAVIGANGAGKSTLLKSICGLVKPREGKVYLNDNDITGRPAYQTARSGICMVPEGRQIFSSLSVMDNLMMATNARKGGEARKSIDRDIERVFDLFPILKERSAQRGGTLSGGQQQMLAIGRGLMSSPSVLLLDEPSLGLAPLLVQEVMRVIQELRQANLAILLVEQNAQAALRIADRGYVLETGRVALQGTGKELLANERVKDHYLGSAAFSVGRAER